jgi:MFS family permease
MAGSISMILLLLLGFGVSSAGNLLSGLVWAVAIAFVMQTIRGVGISAMDVATNTLIQRLVPSAILGWVFGNLYGAIGIAAGLSYVLGGPLLDLTSPRPTFIIVVGTGGLLATLATALALRRATKSNPSQPWVHQAAGIRALGIYAEISKSYPLLAGDTEKRSEKYVASSPHVDLN